MGIYYLLKGIFNFIFDFDFDYKISPQKSDHRSNGVFLAIYGKKFSIHGKELTIPEHHKNSIKTGFKFLFYVFGNKGGVGISFEWEGIKICFVNSHLAAGNKLEKRNEVKLSDGGRGINFMII